MERKTYWYCDWDNYYGSGCVRSTQLTKAEKETWESNRRNPDLYDTWQAANEVLDYHYCD